MARSAVVTSIAVSMLLGWLAVPRTADASSIITFPFPAINTQLDSLDLTGTGQLPLGNNYAPVQSQIEITLDPSQPSKGQATITAFGSPNVVQGESLQVTSFFDVFFDVTITNIDTQPFGGGLPGTLRATGLGPAHLQTSDTCIADLSKPNFGCLPPVGSAYVGHFQVVLPLPVDLNGDGINDQIAFTLASHQVGDLISSSIQGATAIDTFDSSADLSGAISDPGADPPFGPLTLTGPTTAQQDIVVPAIPASEPGAIALLGVGFGLLMTARRGRRRLARG